MGARRREGREPARIADDEDPFTALFRPVPVGARVSEHGLDRTGARERGLRAQGDRLGRDDAAFAAEKTGGDRGERSREKGRGRRDETGEEPAPRGRAGLRALLRNHPA